MDTDSSIDGFVSEIAQTSKDSGISTSRQTTTHQRSSSCRAAIDDHSWLSHCSTTNNKLWQKAVDCLSKGGASPTDMVKSTDRLDSPGRIVLHYTPADEKPDPFSSFSIPKALVRQSSTKMG